MLSYLSRIPGTCIDNQTKQVEKRYLMADESSDGAVVSRSKRLQLEKHKVWVRQQITYATEEGLLPEAERMRQLARDCETEVQEIEAIEAYRKDEERAIIIRIETRE